MIVDPLVPSGGLLAVHAHPDDETLSTGGLLALWAAAGLPTAVVTCTRGEQGEVIGPDLEHLEGSGERFARYREGELSRALSALGVVDHFFLDRIDEQLNTGESSPRYCDSGMAWVDANAPAGLGAAAALPEQVPDDAFSFANLDRAARSLARLIALRAPRYVVTYEPGGGYGHPDHVRTYDVTVRALELLISDVNVSPDQVPTLLSAVVPASIERAARGVLGARSEELAVADDEYHIPQPTDPLAAVSSHDVAHLYALDIAPVAGKVLAALRAHATQIQWVHDWTHDANPAESSEIKTEVIGAYALSNGVYQPLLAHEYYARL